MDVGEVFVPDIGGGEAFEAGRAFVRSIAAMAPGMTLNAIGVSMRVRPKSVDGTPHPSAKDLAFRTVGFTEVFVHLITRLEASSARDASFVSP